MLPVMKDVGGCTGVAVGGHPCPVLLTPTWAAFSPQLCRAARCLSAAQEAAVVEALEVTAAVEAAVAAAAGAPVVVVAAEDTEGAPEGPVEVVMWPAVEETTEGAAKAAGSLGAEVAAPPKYRSSKLLPTPLISTLWSRDEGYCDP